MSEMLPCPFCGGEGIIWPFREHPFYVAICKDGCGCQLGDFKTREEAMQAWNTRAERTCEAVADSQNGLVCSECGSSALVRDWVEMHSWGGGYECVRFATYDYCPNCGRHVVKNDN